MTRGNCTDHAMLTNDHENAGKEPEAALGTSAGPPAAAGPVPRRAPRHRAGARLADAHGWRTTFVGL